MRAISNNKAQTIGHDSCFGNQVLPLACQILYKIVKNFCLLLQLCHNHIFEPRKGNMLKRYDSSFWQHTVTVDFYMKRIL
jgi:hypothetical protein